MHFTRKNVVGKNMIFSIQNSNAKRQPMNMTNPNHSASPRLQFQYSKPNIRQNNHLMSTNMQYSVVKPKGQRLWSPVVHQKLKTRMYCNTVYECNPDYGTCSATTKGLQTYQDCSNTCHITNFYKCDAANYTCTLDPTATAMMLLVLNLLVKLIVLNIMIVVIIQVNMFFCRIASGGIH